MIRQTDVQHVGNWCRKIIPYDDDVERPSTVVRRNRYAIAEAMCSDDVGELAGVRKRRSFETDASVANDKYRISECG